MEVKSLKNFFKLINNTESSCNIQIISLEPLTIFLDVLKKNNVHLDSSYINKANKQSKIQIFTKLTKLNKQNNKINIYYNRNINFQFIHVIFEFTKSEMLEYLGESKKEEININYMFKTLNQIKNNRIQSNKFDIDNFRKIPIFPNFLGKNDIIVLFTIFTCSKLKDILSNVKLSEDSIKNETEILFILNKLKNNLYITETKNIYKVNIPLKLLETLCIEIGFDVKKLY